MSFRSALSIVALIVGAAGSATAQSTWTVDTRASRVYIKVGSVTRLGHPHGIEGVLKSGVLKPGGAGELVFDMASFEADTTEARKRVGLGDKKVSETDAKKVTDAMRGPDVLDVARFPTATYRASAVTPLDKQAPGEPGGYELDGVFALHGVEQKVRFTGTVERAADRTLKMTGSFKIKQTDYGIKPVSALGGLAKVADELEIIGDLVLAPAGK